MPLWSAPCVPIAWTPSAPIANLGQFGLFSSCACRDIFRIWFHPISDGFLCEFHMRWVSLQCFSCSAPLLCCSLSLLYNDSLLTLCFPLLCSLQYCTVLYSLQYCAFLCSLAGVQCGVKRTRTEARHPAAAYHHANNC